MELYQLRTFVTVAEEENATRAAKRLFTTPPSVSAHIKALEEELKVTLFERTPKGMKLTKQGAILRVQAEETLRAAQDLIRQAARMQGQLTGQLKFGINASPAFLRIAQVAGALRERCPGLELNFVTADTGQIIDALGAGRLDAGYIFGQPPPTGLIGHRLGVAELVVTAPQSWARQLEQATWADVAGLPWIASTDYCPFQVIADALFNQHGLTLGRSVHSDDEATKAELVSAGLGLTLLEKSEAEQIVAAGKAFIWPTEAIPCQLSLVYPANRQDEPMVQTLSAAVLEVWATDESLPAGS